MHGPGPIVLLLSAGAYPTMTMYLATCWMYSNWLPLQQRISYRIIALVWPLWRSLLGPAPAYLKDPCCIILLYTAWVISLRSILSGVFRPRHSFPRTAAEPNRCFLVFTPSLWNGLPVAQRLFPKSFHNEWTDFVLFPIGSTLTILMVT